MGGCTGDEGGFQGQDSKYREQQSEDTDVENPGQESGDTEMEESDEESGSDHCHPPEFDEFLSTIRFDELCNAASRLRDGTPCALGEHVVGGFNAIFEINFVDDVTWMARVPLPYCCFQPEEISASYAATLKYLKKYSTIPVPQVYGSGRQSDPTNKTNVTYIFMERMKGRSLPVVEERPYEPTTTEISLVRKVHEQLADIILQLGSLREDSDGNFFVGPFVDSTGTAHPQCKAEMYQSLKPQHRGPYKSTSAWYRGMASLNRRYALVDPDEDDTRDETVAQYEILTELAPRIISKTFNKGPFVIHHNDLTTQNILVDDDFNITAIIDFPGTVVPLPSLCVYPWMFADNTEGIIADRKLYLDAFLSRKDPYDSELSHRRIRKRLMRNARIRQYFEQCHAI
ncbi:hypothetical protein FQN54_006675 [Arachnomyces sp. PD_36]|nr:hypothetical protein FQN54_006675 [Arachnomyces sp. PD_36]